jgi:hypothetical protein
MVGAAFVSLWYVATNHRIGVYVNDHIYGSWSLVIMASMFALVAVLSYSAEVPALGLKSAIGPINRTILPIGIVYVLCMLATWPARKRWAGELLFRAKVPVGNRVMILVPGVINLMHSAGHVFDEVIMGRSDTMTSVHVLYFTFQVLLMVYAYLLLSRVELRSRGVLLNGGRLIPWVKIESYSWESPPRIQNSFRVGNSSEFEYLRLNVKRTIRILPPFHRVFIFAAEVQPIDAIMKRHLSVWPHESKS